MVAADPAGHRRERPPEAEEKTETGERAGARPVARGRSGGRSGKEAA